MKTFNVTTASQTIVASGDMWDSLIIYNNSDTTIYLSTDGSSNALTTSNGLPLAVGAYITLFNNVTAPIKRQMPPVKAIHGGVGNKEVRIQGVD